MSYKIVIVESGIVKEVIESGKKVGKKLMRGEVVEVESVDKDELEAGYYRIFREQPEAPKSIVVPAVDDRSKKLADLIDGMKGMIAVAEKVIASIAEETNYEKPSEVVSESVNADGIPDKFFVDEEKYKEDKDYIFTEQDFDKQNEVYQNVMYNTLNHSLGGSDRRITAKITKKAMPTISEAKLGKIERADLSKIKINESERIVTVGKNFNMSKVRESI